jgi:hypothetical protein
VLACIQGQPPVDALHFAVHGTFDATGFKNGLLMNNKAALSPESIRGAGASRPRLVFLNACQVGQQQEMLGDAAGIVPAFLRIGTQAVIAPLWKVDDAAARSLAERFYAALLKGRTVSQFFAEERTRAAADGDLGKPESTVLAYLFFGHPRLTATDLRITPDPEPATRGAVDGPTAP